MNYLYSTWPASGRKPDPLEESFAPSRGEVGFATVLFRATSRPFDCAPLMFAERGTFRSLVEEAPSA